MPQTDAPRPAARKADLLPELNEPATPGPAPARRKTGGKSLVLAVAAIMLAGGVARLAHL